MTRAAIAFEEWLAVWRNFGLGTEDEFWALTPFALQARLAPLLAQPQRLSRASISELEQMIQSAQKRSTENGE